MYLTQTTRNNLLIAAGLILAVILALAFFKISDSTWDHMIGFGSTSIDLALIALVGVQILLFTAYALFVIQGFRTHWGWGIANLFLPFAALLFFFTYPKRSRVPALTYIAGLVLLGMTMISTKMR
jgi:hypothetical protein